MKCLCWKGRPCKVHPTQAEFGLAYISGSPAREHGGFHPETVKTAKAALRLIRKLRRELKAATRRAGRIPGR